MFLSGASQAAPHGWCEPVLLRLSTWERRSHSPLRNSPTISGTATSIKHVIVIIGENRTFDHVLATGQPKRGEAVSNCSNRTVLE